MFSRAVNGLRHTAILLGALFAPRQRDLLRRMVAFSRALPRQFHQPLPEMMARLTPAGPDPPGRMVSQTRVRRLADAVAAWHFRSPLGLCLRRALLRYYFLRLAGLPVKIVFGARLKSAPEGGGLGGHAWLTLNNAPYFEPPENYRGFVQMYVFPEEDSLPEK